jgi:homospermidine synthase
MERRVQKAKALKHIVSYDNPILILGMGSLGRGLLPLLFQLIKFKPDQLTVIDKVDIRDAIDYYIKKGIHFKRRELTKQNYKTLLKPWHGGLFIDCSYDVYTLDMITYCNKHNMLFVNTAMEEWDYRNPKTHTKTQDYSLYVRQMEIREFIREKAGKGNPTAVMCCGANPGFVSILVKRGIMDIVHALISEGDLPAYKIERLKKYAKAESFKLLAMELGIKVIHISEKDTQITNQARELGEFLNTWSPLGMQEEAQSCSELGWGTHEKTFPYDGAKHNVGDRNQICLHTRGANTVMTSWIHSEKINGLLIRHDESYTISDRYSVYPADLKNPKSYLEDTRNVDHKQVALYRPTVHYVYRASDSALASTKEFADNGFINLPKQRIMYNDVISGQDKLGCTIIGDFCKRKRSVWWIGSLMSIEEARAIHDPKKNCVNATNIQVASGMMGAIIYAINHPTEGVLMPDDMEYKQVLKTTLPFWGSMYSGWVDVDPADWDRIKDFQFESFRYKDEI